MQLCPSKALEIKENEPLKEVSDFITNIKNITQRYQSFDEVEADVKELMNRLESALLSECLEQYDIHTKVIVKNGMLYRHVLREEKTYLTCAGKVNVARSLYRGTDGKNICPLELQAGIVEGSWTPSAARAAYYITAQLSPYQGEKLLKELGRFTPSKSSLDRLSRSIGLQWEAYHDEFFSTLSDAITIPAETVCFYNNEGERLKTLRFGRMPEAKKKILKEELSQTITKILTQKSDLTLVKLADGARDDWRYLGKVLRLGEGIEILDFYHASEHLNKAIEWAYGKDTSAGKSHYKKYRSLLKHDEIGVSKVIRTLNYLHKKHPKRKQIKIELNYFRNNRQRMNYAKATAEKLPIGSGVTEASCKTLVTQRLKCSGMRWDIPGGQGVDRFNCCNRDDKLLLA